MFQKTLNSKNGSAKLAAVSLLVILLLAGGYYFWIFADRTHQAPTRVASQDPYKEKLEQDRQLLKKVIRSKTINPYLVYGALVRLSEIKDPLPLELFDKLLKSEQQLLRQGVALSVGHYDDAIALPIIKKLVHDSAPKLREFSIKSLGYRASSKRTKYLLKLIQENKKYSDASIMTHASLYQIEKEPKTKAKYLNQLISMANIAPLPASERAGLKLIEIAPNNKEVHSFIKQSIKDNKKIRLMSAGIRLLATHQSKDLKPQLASLSNHRSHLIRRAVIQSLHRICPDDLWSILDNYVTNEKDPNILSLAISEARLVPGPEAQLFLKRVLQSKAVPASVKNLATKIQNLLNKKSHRQNPCGNGA